MASIHFLRFYGYKTVLWLLLEVSWFRKYYLRRFVTLF